MFARFSLIAVVIFGLLGVGILVALGAWQSNRLDWKEGILKDIALKQQNAPAELPSDALNNNDILYGKYVLNGHPAKGSSLYFYGQAGDGLGIGYFPYHAFWQDDGTWVIAQLGFIPLEQGDQFKNPVEYLTQDPMGQRLSGTFVPRLSKGSFIPENDQDKNVWHWHDFTAIAEHFGLDEAKAIPLALIAENEFGYISVPPRIDLPNTHFQYMVTWYSLAVVWAFMSLLLFMRERKRLSNKFTS